MIKARDYFHTLCITFLLFSVIAVPGVLAAETCLDCHSDLGIKPIRHRALDLGCDSCHSGIDAATIPHRVTGGGARGLSADGAELCFGCHDSSPFSKKHDHGPAGAGLCIVCHNVHSSQNKKLLSLAVPALCFTCHDRKGFDRKYGHGPAEAGLCLTCHDPHASNEKEALLVKKPVDVCLYCHTRFTREVHIVSGWGGGHPVGLTRAGKKWKRLKDPLRPGKRFSCASCHDPHSSGSGFMVRFAAKSSFDTCSHCHVKEARRVR